MKFAKAWLGVHKLDQVQVRPSKAGLSEQSSPNCQLRSQRSLWPKALHIFPNQAQALEEGCGIWPRPCCCRSTADSHLALHPLVGAARRGNVSRGNLIQRPHSKTITHLRWLRSGLWFSQSHGLIAPPLPCLFKAGEYEVPDLLGDPLALRSQVHQLSKAC